MRTIDGSCSAVERRYFILAVRFRHVSDHVEYFVTFLELSFDTVPRFAAEFADFSVNVYPPQDYLPIHEF